MSHDRRLVSSSAGSSPQLGPVLGLWRRQVYPTPSLPQDLQKPALISFAVILPGPTCPFSYFFLWRAGLGWGVTVLAGFADASRGRDGDLGGEREAVVYNPLHSPQCAPFTSWLPGAAPTEQRSPLGCRSMTSPAGPPASSTVGTGMVRALGPAQEGGGRNSLQQSPRQSQGQVQATRCLGLSWGLRGSS